jgi:hypothetical protein
MAKSDVASGTGSDSLRVLMRRALAPKPIEVVSLPALAPLLAGRHVHPVRDASLPPLADLSGRPKLLLLAGPGQAGKTTTANFLISLLSDEGLRKDTLVAATDPGVVGLAEFLPDGLHQPENRTPAAAEELVADVFAAVESDEAPPVTIVDTGGGSTALQTFLAKHPKAIERLEAKGAAVIMLWHWTPRAKDLALLQDFNASCPRPTATAMVLNGALARDGWDAYDTLRGQDVYHRMLEGGAAEVWMPALRQETALMVERRGILFGYARDGKVPVWKTGVQPAEGDAAVEVGLWMAEAEDEWRAARTWVRP